jgi:hypothetical protein
MPRRARSSAVQRRVLRGRSIVLPRACLAAGRADFFGKRERAAPRCAYGASLLSVAVVLSPQVIRSPSKLTSVQSHLDQCPSGYKKQIRLPEMRHLPKYEPDADRPEIVPLEFKCSE